ncbi:retrotransposon protein, putative, ty1-copia subclass [Tanacetum coccineum]
MISFLILYVDDVLIMGNNIPMLQDVKSWLGKYFAMKDLGETTYILGIKIYRDRSKRLIGLKKPNLSKTQGASTPEEGGYLERELRVTCYTDAGFEIDKDDRKFQSGYIFVLNEGAIDWKSAKQSTTVMSSIESKYIAALEAMMEAV